MAGIKGDVRSWIAIGLVVVVIVLVVVVDGWPPAGRKPAVTPPRRCRYRPAPSGENHRASTENGHRLTGLHTYSQLTDAEPGLRWDIFA
jgi:hypothetical protein